MLVLALDTATSAITAAVRDDDGPRAQRSVLDTRRHTEDLAPVLDAVLREAGSSIEDVTHLGVGTGPGPFTGLRVGIVTAMTLGHVLGVPVHGICSLDALARTHARSLARSDVGEFLVATDARRKEVYWARYAVVSGGRVERLGGPEVTRPADLGQAVRELPCIGRGPVLYPEWFPNGTGPYDVSAVEVAEATFEEVASGRHTSPVPRYLRRPDAREPGQPNTVPPGGIRR